MADSKSAFAIPELYKTSAFSIHDDDALLKIDDLAILEIKGIGENEQLPYKQEFDRSLPDLAEFEYGPVEDLADLEEISVYSLESLDARKEDDDGKDHVWTSLSRIPDGPVSVDLTIWDGFYGIGFQIPWPVCLSDAGAHAVDAALSRHSQQGQEDIDTEPLLASLVQLSQGRESALYGYVKEEKTFRARKENLRGNGYDSKSSSNLVASIITHGNRMLDLQVFVTAARNPHTSSPTLVAIAGGIQPIVGSIQDRTGDAANRFQSILQLRAILEGTGQVVSCLCDVIASIQRSQTDEEILSSMYTAIREARDLTPDLSAMLLGLLTVASRPWLDHVGHWLGLQSDACLSTVTPLPNFVVTPELSLASQSLSNSNLCEYEYSPAALPSFISKEDGVILYETGKKLRLLHIHGADHPLVRTSAASSGDCARLEWQVPRRHIEELAAKAEAYEMSLRAAVEDFNASEAISTSTELVCEDLVIPQLSADDFITSSRMVFERSLPNIRQPGDTGVPEGDDALILPTTLPMHLPLDPIVAVQARLVDEACLRLLFKHYNPTKHFSLLHRYVLLADGVFASSLSHALFNPSLSSAVRRPGHSRSSTSGLQLGSRRTWPLASSELRLALMGILTDSYFGIHHQDATSIFRQSLPGGLSFAVREMSEEKLKQCMDPSSIEALDFLRLQYTPPAPLDTVITHNALIKYDAIFKRLFRIERMQFVVHQLSNPRQPHRPGHEQILFLAFKSQSYHFVSTICTYFFNCITTHWRTLEHKLSALETAIETDSYGPEDNVSNLSGFHEDILDRIMLALLLHQSQNRIMDLLQEIFSIILRFAWYTTSRKDEEELVDGSLAQPKQHQHQDIKELHATFKQKTKLFVEMCRTLSEQKGMKGTTAPGDGDGDDDTDEDTTDAKDGKMIDQLLLGFEMNGFYTR